MDALAARLLEFTTYRAPKEDEYKFVLLDTDDTKTPWPHQREAFLTMDDPGRQSTRIIKVDDIYYWLGHDGIPSAMWISKTTPPPVPTPAAPPLPPRHPKVTQLHGWSQAKMDVVAPHILVGNDWQSYAPRANTIYAILPGLNRASHLMQAQDGANFNVVLQKRWDESYDHYQYRNPHGRNLRTLAQLVLQDIRDLISAENGPAAIVCGSRGGQETMLELSRYWRGLVFDFNGGYLTGCAREYREIPDGVQLVSVLGRLDFFYYTQGRPRVPRDFEALRLQKLEFLKRSVARRGRGNHTLYASAVIDHSLEQLDGRRLILSVMQGVVGTHPIRAEDHVCRISI